MRADMVLYAVVYRAGVWALHEDGHRRADRLRFPVRAAGTTLYHHNER